MIIVPFCKCIVITREFKKEDGYVGVELYLTFKKGFVIGRSHCGHHMWRDGFTDYVKLILRHCNKIISENHLLGIIL